MNANIRNIKISLWYDKIRDAFTALSEKDYNEMRSAYIEDSSRFVREIGSITPLDEGELLEIHSMLFPVKETT